MRAPFDQEWPPLARLPVGAFLHFRLLGLARVRHMAPPPFSKATVQAKERPGARGKCVQPPRQAGPDQSAASLQQRSTGRSRNGRAEKRLLFLTGNRHTNGTD
jgi:hypothetical protein